MSGYGAEMILGMAKDLNDQYQRGFQAGKLEGKREAFAEARELLRETFAKDKEDSDA